MDKSTDHRNFFKCGIKLDTTILIFFSMLIFALCLFFITVTVETSADC